MIIVKYPFQDHFMVLNYDIVDFGVAHIFDTLNSEESNTSGKERIYPYFH